MENGSGSTWTTTALNKVRKWKDLILSQTNFFEGVGYMGKWNTFNFHSWTVVYLHKQVILFFQAKSWKTHFGARPFLLNNLRGLLGLPFASKPGEVCLGSMTRVKAVPVFVVLCQFSGNLEITHLEPELCLLEQLWTWGLLKDLQSCFIWKIQGICSLNFNKDGAGRQRQLMFDLKYRFDPFLASSV